MTVGVGSHDGSRNSRLSEVTTHAGSSDSQSLNLRGDCGRRKSRRSSEVPTVGSSDSQKSRPKSGVSASVVLLACCPCPSELPTYVGSSDRRNSRPMSGVPTPAAVLAGCLTVHVGSSDHRKSQRLPGVLTLTCTHGLLTLCE